MVKKKTSPPDQSEFTPCTFDLWCAWDWHRKTSLEVISQVNGLFCQEKHRKTIATSTERNLIAPVIYSIFSCTPGLAQTSGVLLLRNLAHDQFPVEPVSSWTAAEDKNLKRDWFFQEKIAGEPESGWLELRWIMPRGNHRSIFAQYGPYGRYDVT